MIKLPFVKVNLFKKLSESSLEFNFESLFINSNLLVNHYQLPVTNKNLKDVLTDISVNDPLPNSFVKWFYQEGIVYFNNNVLEEIYEFKTEENSNDKIFEFVDVVNYISSFRMYLTNVCKLIVNHVAGISEKDKTNISNFFSAKDLMLRIDKSDLPFLNFNRYVSILDKYFLVSFKFIRNFDVRKIHKPVNTITLNEFFIMLNQFIKELDIVLLDIISSKLDNTVKLTIDEETKRIVAINVDEINIAMMDLINLHFSEKYARILKSFM